MQTTLAQRDSEPLFTQARGRGCPTTLSPKTYVYHKVYLYSSGQSVEDLDGLTEMFEAKYGISTQRNAIFMELMQLCSTRPGGPKRHSSALRSISSIFAGCRRSIPNIHAAPLQPKAPPPAPAKVALGQFLLPLLRNKVCCFSCLLAQDGLMDWVARTVSYLRPTTTEPSRKVSPTERGAWKGLAEKVGQKVGETLAKGWHRVGEGLAGFLAPSHFAIPEAPF